MHRHRYGDTRRQQSLCRLRSTQASTAARSSHDCDVSLIPVHAAIVTVIERGLMKAYLFGGCGSIESGWALGQTADGRIAGAVADTTGAPLSGASIIVTNERTGQA